MKAAAKFFHSWLALFLVALSLRLAYAFMCRVEPVWGDMGFVNTFSAYVFYNNDLWGFTTFRTPGLPVFVAGCYALFGLYAFTAVFVSQAVLSAVAVLFVKKMGEKFFAPEVACLAAWGACFYPDFILACITYTGEPLAMFFYMAAFVLFFGKTTHVKTALAGAFAALACYAKPSVQFFVPGMMLAAVFVDGFKKRVVVRCVLFFAVCLLFVLPAVMGNYARWGRVMAFSDHGWFNFYNFNNALVTKGGGAPPFTRLESGPNPETDFRREGFLFIKNHPAHWARNLVNDIAVFFGAEHDPFLNRMIVPSRYKNERILEMYKTAQTDVLVDFYIPEQHRWQDWYKLGVVWFARVFNAVFVVCLLFGLAGGTALAGKKAGPLIAVLPYLLLYTLMFNMLPRYRNLVMPVLLIYSAGGVFALKNAFKIGVSGLGWKGWVFFAAGCLLLCWGFFDFAGEHTRVLSVFDYW